jgi:NADPH:quinone reductase-like Zn-dependent oxidoreductase
MQTEAWILRQAAKGEVGPGTLEKTTYPLPEMGDYNVLAEPIYGAWEANMTHALERKPVDICRIRREECIVLGNAGVVRILKTGSKVTTCRVGDVCGIVPVGSCDGYGHMIKVLGYDMPGIMGMLARQVVWPEENVAPLANPSKHAYQRWAGFPVRYCTAWENWKLSFNVWRSQFDLQEQVPPPHVSGWGGGVTLAQVELAKHFGASVSMVASNDLRIRQLESLGIKTIDRREFPNLEFDEQRFESDRSYRASYLTSEKAFLDRISEATDGNGVSIFIDNIGGPVMRASLRALGRLGIITTAGWKCGKYVNYDRPTQCVRRNIFVHTHGCRRTEGLAARDFAEEHGWLPPPGAEEYAWEDIPQLAADYAAGRLSSYAPVFRINPL